MSRAKKVAVVIVAIVVVAALSGFLGLLPLYAHLYRETVTVTALYPLSSTIIYRTASVTVTMQPIECVMKTETVTVIADRLGVYMNQTVTTTRTMYVTIYVPTKEIPRQTTTVTQR